MSNFSLEVYPVVPQWECIQEKIKQLSEQQQWKTEQQFDITLICEEWFMNIVNHSQSDPKMKTYVEVEQLASGVVRMYFSDPGIPFTPFKNPAATEITANVEQRLGGLGIHFIQSKIFDHKYKYENNRNQLEMFYITKK